MHYGEISTGELLAKLRRLLREQGFLSQQLISMTRGMPFFRIYADCFGSMIKAYELVGPRRPPKLPH